MRKNIYNKKLTQAVNEIKNAMTKNNIIISKINPRTKIQRERKALFVFKKQNQKLKTKIKILNKAKLK